MKIYDIIQQLNAENGSNYKMAVLREHKDNLLLQKVLKMTYDRVDYTFGISMKNVNREPRDPGSCSLEHAIKQLEERFATRSVTGNEAVSLLSEIFSNLTEEDAVVLRGIVNRDLRINMGRSNINKVFKGLIVKPVYMRCGLFNEKTRKNVNPQGAYVQLKADGTYREFTVEHGVVTCISRSGEQYDYPRINEVMRDFPDGHYIGELTVVEKDRVLIRAIGNGMINSDNPPHDQIIVDLWDYVTLKEYTNAANKIKGTTPYHERFDRLQEIVGHVGNQAIQRVRVIEYFKVNSFAEALEHTSNWMKRGLEGAIIKDCNAIFRDGTNPQQLKMKLEIDVDVRITGFKEGTPGTKREKTFGAMTFETDDGKIRGRTSGFTDAQLEDFNNRREELVGQIMTVTCNDITHGQENDYYALSHPRFVELRNDKTETDTLERALETKEMSMTVGE